MIVLIVFGIALCAFGVSVVAGGGAGLVLVPLLRLLVPMAQVPAALSIGTAVGSLARIHAFRRHVRWDVARWFAPAALPMAALGAWALSRFETAYVELLIGLFLLGNLPALFRRSTEVVSPARPISRRSIVLIGAAAGFVSGFTGAVGLLFNGAYRRMGLSRAELVATRAANEIALHAVKIALYAAFGLLDRAAMLAGALVAVAALVAAYGMRHLLSHLNERLFRAIGNATMVAAGAAMFLMSSRQVLAIHRAWASIVTSGDEREFQLYWGGQRRFVLEWEDDNTPVIERRIDRDDLTPAQQATADRLARTARITLIEEVYGWRGRYVEIYLQDARGTRKVEVR